MRALQLISSGVIAVGDVPVPEIGPGEVLVKVAGAGLCHSDLHALAVPDWPMPGIVMGHETAGHVVSVGAAVTAWHEGDPVLVCLVWACGTCRACQAGRDNACITTGGRLGVPPCPGFGPDGGMAEYIKVGTRHLEHLGALDPVTAGPLADAGLTPMHAIRSARHRLTDNATAVVIGVGGLGHLGLQLLKATTSARILAVDVDPAKLEIAQTHGADETIVAGTAAAAAVLELTEGYGADVVFDFVGVQSSVDLALGAVAPDGVLRFVGLGGGGFRHAADPTSVPLPWGVDVQRSYGGTRDDQREVLALARAGKIEVLATTYALKDGRQAFADLEAGRVVGRAVLVP